MKINLRKHICAQIVCLSLWPVLLFAQSADLDKGPAVCKSGTEVCEQSKMIQVQPQSKAGTADHQYNVAACRNGWGSCDRSKLTATEIIALAVAEHERNVSNCSSGLGFCDRSELQSQVAVNTAEQQLAGAGHGAEAHCEHIPRQLLDGEHFNS